MIPCETNRPRGFKLGLHWKNFEREPLWRLHQRCFAAMENRSRTGFPLRIELVCRYVVEGEEFSTESSVRLSREESIELARAVTTAPIAPPCTRSASRVAHTALLRADGSGGATVFVALDGCGRVYLDGYRTLVPDQVAILSR